MRDAGDGTAQPDMREIKRLRGGIWNQTARVIESADQGTPLPWTGGWRLAADTEPRIRLLEPAVGPSPAFLPPVVVSPRDALTLAAFAVGKGHETPVVLVPAAARHPGGSVVAGAGAFEENVHRRTDLARFTIRMARYYPIPVEACLVARNVTVFRGPEADGYPFLESPFLIHVVLAAAHKAPPLAPAPPPLSPREMGYATDEAREAMRRAVGCVLAAMAETGASAFVLAAFGCGAFGHPPFEVADIFRGALAAQAAVGGAPGVALFPILDDHNTGLRHNPTGNFRPFARVFSPALPLSPRSGLPAVPPPPLRPALSGPPASASFSP